MEKTTNYKLYKPSYDDDVDIQILNNNMDILDGKLKEINDAFLPLRGGTMTGSIVTPYNDGSFIGVKDTLKLSFHNNNYNNVNKETAGFNCARFMCYLENEKNLMADETGIWFSGSKVITDYGTVTSDTTGYTKLSNGLIIQWGVFNDVPTGIQINFPTPFKGTLFSVTVNGLENANRRAIQYFSVYDYTTTGFKVLSQRFDNSVTNDYGRYIAIGF